MASLYGVATLRASIGARARMAASLPYWPAMMRRATAAKYCELSPAEFEREISDGRLPMPVRLGNSEHWSRAQLDVALEILASGGQDWFSGSPLYEGKAA